MSDQTFKTGDTVCLNSETNVLLTIYDLSGESAKCVYFSRIKGEFLTVSLPIAAIFKSS